ncbi:MAG TPA: NAD(P)-dependent oxidoreductase [Pseudonocardiaceae bacterium]|nr:NAD(P)-dependent oxidoreductase [Pseudonocardiaceae bacterium]
MRVAVLGLGNMGRAFAARALERGHHVTVWNRSAGKAGDLVVQGATEVSTVAQAASRAEVILVSLADDAAVLDVCLGLDGALAAMRPGTVLVDVSTVSPDTARELAAAGPEGAVLDAPVQGAPSLIAAGGGQFLVGGAAESVGKLDPLWSDLGAGYTHCGPPGSGAVVKLVSNLQLMIGVTALAEAIATARRNGIDDDLLRTVFAESAVVSAASRLRLDSLLSDDHPGWFSPELARKDVRHAIALAEQQGVPVRLGPATENLLTAVIEAGGQWPDFSSVIEALAATRSAHQQG